MGSTADPFADARANNASIQQGAMRDWAMGMINRQDRLQQQANREIKQRQGISEKMFAGMMNQYQNDPMFKNLKASVYSWMSNPGLSQGTLRKLKAQAQARAAADLASNQRNVRMQASRQGLSGEQVVDALTAANSRGSANLDRSLTDIDLRNEQMTMDNRARAIGAGQDVLSNYYGGLGRIGNAYAGVMGSYNPQVAPLNVADLMASIYSNPRYGG